MKIQRGRGSRAPIGSGARAFDEAEDLRIGAGRAAVRKGARLRRRTWRLDAADAGVDLGADRLVLLRADLRSRVAASDEACRGRWSRLGGAGGFRGGGARR